ncbi:hypothetical protein SLE2022_051100 [Rubroshorea leprosula]
MLWWSDRSSTQLRSGTELLKNLIAEKVESNGESTGEFTRTGETADEIGRRNLNFRCLLICVVNGYRCFRENAEPSFLFLQFSEIFNRLGRLRRSRYEEVSSKNCSFFFFLTS